MTTKERKPTEYELELRRKADEACEHYAKVNMDKANEKKRLAEREATYKPLTDFGCKFFPLKVNSKRPHQSLKSWQSQSTETVPPDGGVGVNLAAGLVIIDVDSIEALERVRKIEGWSEDTFAVKTPRGMHFYWEASGKHEIPQFAGNNPVLGEGVDSRIGGKGYVVGPLSVIYDRKYKVHTQSQINVLPKSLESILIKKDTRPVIDSIVRTDGGSVKVPEGSRNMTMASIAGHLFNTNASNKSIREAMHQINADSFEPMMEESEVDRTHESIQKKARGDSDRNGVLVKTERTREETVSNCVEALGIKIRFNTRFVRDEINWDDAIDSERVRPEGWAMIDDREEANLFNEIERRCISMPRVISPDGRLDGMEQIEIKGEAAWKRALNIIANQNQSDPFVDTYLDKLPRVQNDALLNGWLKEIVPLEDSDDNMKLAEWGSKYLALGVVQRSYQPGSKIDEMLVIKGMQGIGKSSLCSSMIPEEFRDECFTDRLNLTDGVKEIAETIQGTAIAEASEMTGMGRAEIEKIKSLLSATSEKVRLAYRRNPERIKRRCIFVGTTNEDCLPNDPTGNRRFVMVETEGKRAYHAVEGWLDKNRDDIFSAALYAFENGEKANLPRELYEIRDKVNDNQRIRDDLIEDAVLEVVPIIHTINDTDTYSFPSNTAEACEFSKDAMAIASETIDGREVVYVSINDVTTLVRKVLDKNSDGAVSTTLQQHRLKKAMKQCGFIPSKKRVRFNGTMPRLWELPERVIEKNTPQVGDVIEDSNEIPF